MDYRIIIGSYSDRNFVTPSQNTINEKYLQKLRVFNETQELLNWKDKRIYIGRFRTAGKEIIDANVIVPNQVLFGTSIKSTII